MARRSKEEAAATREGILDAAESLFVRQGVARTTLQEIATAAGVTRGAVYWHFDDKGTLFNAMMGRATLPLESDLHKLAHSNPLNPLDELHQYILTVLRQTVENPQTRRVFEIATLKVEFVEEMDAVRQRRASTFDKWMGRATWRLTLAKERRLLDTAIDPDTAALAIWIMVDGLLRTWLFDPDNFDLIKQGAHMVGKYFDGLRAATGSASRSVDGPSRHVDRPYPI